MNKIAPSNVRFGDTIEWIWIGTHNEFDNLIFVKP